MSANKWAHNLGIGIARARGELTEDGDEQEFIAVGNEALLASVLREIANRAHSDDSYFLNALADAFDHPQARYRLKLRRTKRGRQPDPSRIMKCLTVGTRNQHLQGRGWSKEAAVAQLMEDYSLSRSAVFRHLKRFESVWPIFEKLFAESDAAKSAKSDN